MNKDATSSASKTDWARVEAMRDEDIDLSDIPEVIEEKRAHAVLRMDGQLVPKGNSPLRNQG